jgi:hypothetical protein
MRNFAGFFALMAIFTLTPSAFGGLLTSDSVTLEIVNGVTPIFGPGVGSFFGPPTVVAGAGDEFTIGAITVDVDSAGAGDLVTLSTSVGGTIAGVATTTTEFRFTSLDFATSLSSVNIITDIGAGVTTPTLTADSVTFRWAEVVVASGVFFQAQFVPSAGGGGAVPEPGTMAMFLMGGLGLVAARRRRRK